MTEAMPGRAAALRALAVRFRAAGVDTPDLDARVLLRHAAGIGLEDVLRDPDLPLPPAAVAALEAAAQRRLAGEPVARITGEKEFWGLSLLLGPDTLVPRPDTETVMAAALALPGLRTRPAAVLDLGTGSGAILLALLTELPLAWGIGLDRAAGAARAARANARHLGVDDRCSFVVGDWGEALAGRFDVIVSNPPYVAADDIAALAPEVRLHDPRLALNGGADGLDAYRILARESVRLLRPGGHVVVELGVGQEEAVAALFAAAGLTVQGPARRDFSDIPRALTACHELAPWKADAE